MNIMIQFGNHRKKYLLIEMVSFLIVAAIFIYGYLRNPNMFEDPYWCLGFIIYTVLFVGSFYQIFFKWKVITISSTGIYEDYYGINFSNPYKVKEITTWKRIKEVKAIHRFDFLNYQPFSIRIDFIDERGKKDYYYFDTHGFYFMYHKGLKFDPAILEPLKRMCEENKVKLIIE